jgi:DNA-binding IclR family transcriptional regulator
LLAALVRAGFADHGAGGLYRLGLKAWEIGRSVPVSRLLQVAGPFMSDLAARTREGVILGLLDGFEVAYVDKVESEQTVRVHAALGDRIAAHCTSTGLALLSELDDAHVDRLLPATLSPMTPFTIVDRGALHAELRRTRARGYAINRGGWQADVGGIAASISIRRTRVSLAAGVCIALPRYRMTRPWIAHTAPLLVRCASRIGEALSADEPDVA